MIFFPGTLSACSLYVSHFSLSLFSTCFNDKLTEYVAHGAALFTVDKHKQSAAIYFHLISSKAKNILDEEADFDLTEKKI